MAVLKHGMLQKRQPTTRKKILEIKKKKKRMIEGKDKKYKERDRGSERERQTARERERETKQGSFFLGKNFLYYEVFANFDNKNIFS